MNKSCVLVFSALAFCVGVNLANGQTLAPTPGIAPAPKAAEVGRYSLVNGRLGDAEVTFRIDSASGEVAVVTEQADTKTGARVAVMVRVIGTPDEEEVRRMEKANMEKILGDVEKVFGITLDPGVSGN